MSSDLLSLAKFKSTTPTCFHWNPYSEEKQSQMSIIHNYHSAFSWFNHHCPLHTTANTLICFSWIMCSTLEMNPKFKILNACCMFCKWTQPLCISSLQTAFLSPEQCFQHCIAFFPEMYTTSILQTQGKEEKQTINHQKRNRCYTFPSPSSCETLRMFKWEKEGGKDLLIF